ncbi:MAG: hypothetical protein IKZ38_02170 [Clostridia bacterium]|nr:hypothetical protein [Clostridia bacterium]
MITYVINTSENRTFDSDQLFRLAGYKKIHWLNSRLGEVDQCIEYIKNKQGAIESEEFRVAVIVDFFGFDKIRKPYGRNGYASDAGVECSLYLPYIEGYLTDKLFLALEKKELYSSDYEVFYIKGGKLEIIDNLSNLKEQIDQILEPVESSYVETRKGYVKEDKTFYVSEEGKSYTEAEYEQLKVEIDKLNKRLYENLTEKQKSEVLSDLQVAMDELDQLKAQTREVKSIIEEKAYTEFDLYCTPNLSLRYRIDEFPYIINVNKEDGISTRQFFEAFCDRSIKSKKIRRYFYNTSLGGSAAKSAFENLALYLNLIRLYEREDELKEDGVIDVNGINPEQLKDLLLNAWNKIVQAKKVAKENNSLYYSLKNIQKKNSRKKEFTKLTPEEEFSLARAKIVLPDDEKKNSLEKQYSFIMSMGKKEQKIFIDKDKEEFDDILSKYLEKRNDMTEREVEEDFNERIKSGKLETTNQCPPKQECDYVVGQKQDEISRLMEKVLDAEYSVQQFEEEQRAAKKYYEKYLEAKKVLQRGTLGDIIFFILTLAVVLVPYIVLKSITGFNYASVGVVIACCAVFFGLLAVSFMFALLPAIKKMKNMKKLMLECYKDCLAKKKVALSQLRKRYEVDLIDIEECRYEIRQIVYLYKLNIKKNRNVNLHRNKLDEVENCLGTILNNLGIHPVVDNNVRVEREFNVNKPILSYENKIYKIFSLDAIETLLINTEKGVI